MTLHARPTIALGDVQTGGALIARTGSGVIDKRPLQRTSIKRDGLQWCIGRSPSLSRAGTRLALN
jgi:hypothetical protein